MGRNRRRERRTGPQRFEDRVRSSPATLILLTVSGVLMATAAATAIFGSGFSDATPHERLLGVLESVAVEQAEHRQAAGQFAERNQELSVDVPSGVELTVLRGGDHAWEALAREPEHGLSCSQSGRWEDGRAIREQPICYRDAR